MERSKAHQVAKRRLGVMCALAPRSETKRCDSALCGAERRAATLRFVKRSEALLLGVVGRIKVLRLSSVYPVAKWCDLVFHARNTVAE